MRYLFCLIILVGCSHEGTLKQYNKYKTGDLVATKLGETGLIIEVNNFSTCPYVIEITNSHELRQYPEECIIKEIE